MNADKLISKLLKEKKAWLANPRNKSFMVDDAISDLQKALAKPFEPSVRGRLDKLSTWEGNVGVVSVLESDQGGWVSIQRALSFRAWSIRLRAGFQDRGQTPKIDANDICLRLVHSIAVQNDALASFLGARALNSFGNSGSAIDGWQLSPFEPFALATFCWWKGVEFPPEGVNVVLSKPYLSVFHDWADLPKFQKALLDCCDFHLANVEDKNDKGFPPFEWTPYDLFPAEILAVKRIRLDAKLPFPELKHPLMQTPLASPPSSVLDERHELLDKIIAKARADGLAGDPW